MTTLIAFTPLLFVPGVAGEFFRNIPLIVIPILLLSLLESFFILPAHLAHSQKRSWTFSGAEKVGQWGKKLSHFQQRFARGLAYVNGHYYCPFIQHAIALRYLTLAIGLAILFVVLSLPIGGYVAFNFFPKLQGDIVSVDITLPVGSAREETREVMKRITAAARTVIDRHEEPDKAFTEGIFASLGRGDAGTNEPQVSTSQASAHRASIAVALVPSGERDLGARDFSEQWREEVGTVVGVDNLQFNYSVSPSAGAKVAIELAHEDRDVLREAAQRLAEQLQSYAGVTDIDDGFSQGKEEIQLALKPAARVLMGYDLSLVSMLGLVALAGVVVNDSLVLVASINNFRSDPDKDIYDAVLSGVKRRFRPVILTSLTTFFGLAPMIFETSLQARFLIPMAISLGFGVLFVTAIVLILVPILCYIIEDIKRALQQRATEHSHS